MVVRGIIRIQQEPGLLSNKENISGTAFLQRIPVIK